MKSLFSALLFISVLSGCVVTDGKSEDWSRFARPSEFQLATPTIAAAPASRILSEPTSLQLILDREGTDLHYTWDGSTPTQDSPRYVAPLERRIGGELKVVAFGAGFRPSAVARAQFVSPGHVLSDVHIEPDPSAPYVGSGTKTLLDGVAGSADFRDRRWLGFQSAVTVTIDLGEKVKVTRVLVGTREDPSSWIFFPKSLAVEVSATGDHYEPWATLEEPPEATPLHFLTVRGDECAARWLRIEISPPEQLPEHHPGYPDGKPWLFLDEIIVEGL